MSLFWVAFAALAAICPANAQVMGGDPLLATPNGDPTGPANAYETVGGIRWHVSVITATSAAIFLQDGPTLESVLAAQGISAANGWTINRVPLSGRVFSLNTYYAAASGGASAPFRLDYTPGVGDPSGAAAHWIQMIDTNSPTKDAIDSGTIVKDVNGNSWSIDDIGNAAGNPYYDPIGDAGPTYFHDDPFRDYSNMFWRGYTYVVSGDLDAKTLNISTGCIYWGFDDPSVAVPEPNAFALCLIGTTVLRRLVRRKRPESQG